MRTFFCQGSLGDTFIIVCKLYTIRDRIVVNHRTLHTYFYGAIDEIYNFLPNIILKFTKEERYDLEEITSDSHEDDMEFFPEFKFDSRFNWIKEPYIVIQPHSGKPHHFNSKKMSKPYVNELIYNLKDDKIVLLGTDPTYSDISGCINLIGQTSIKESYEIIKRSCSFIGPEGLLSFMALSLKKESLILYRSQEAVDKRIVNTPWDEYASLTNSMEEIWT